MIDSKQLRNIIHFEDLPYAWQIEAISNLNEYAENALYLEPLNTDIPGIHVLWDLEDCQSVRHQDYDAVIHVSNNSTMGVKFATDETCYLIPIS